MNNVGDKFNFNIGLMKKNNINLPSTEDQNNIHTVLNVINEDGLGNIITYKINPDAQVNEVWITKI